MFVVLLQFLVFGKFMTYLSRKEMGNGYTKASDMSDAYLLRRKFGQSVANKGWKAIHQACSSDNVEATRRILAVEPEKVHALDAYGETPLHKCAKVECAALLLAYGARLDARAAYGKSPVHSSAANGNVKVLRLLIKERIAWRATDSLDRNALHYSVAEERLSCVEKLLRNGIHVTQRDTRGRTPLFLAVSRGNVDTVELLCVHLRR